MLQSNFITDLIIIWRAKEIMDLELVCATTEKKKKKNYVIFPSLLPARNAMLTNISGRCFGCFHFISFLSPINHTLSLCSSHQRPFASEPGRIIYSYLSSKLHLFSLFSQPYLIKICATSYLLKRDF